MVGIERKNENSSAAERDKRANWPAEMVDMEREVPGKTAERIWQAPIQIACGRRICSMRSMRTRRNSLSRESELLNKASISHIATPPAISAQAIRERFSRCLPMTLVSSQEGTAVTTKAIMVKVSG